MSNTDIFFIVILFIGLIVSYTVILIDTGGHTAIWKTVKRLINSYIEKRKKKDI